MADENANGELTVDELKADEYKLQANEFFKGRAIVQFTFLVWVVKNFHKNRGRFRSHPVFDVDCRDTFGFLIAATKGAD